MADSVTFEFEPATDAGEATLTARITKDGTSTARTVRGDVAEDMWEKAKKLFDETLRSHLVMGLGGR